VRTLLTLALLAVSMTAAAQSTTTPADAAAQKPSRPRNTSLNPADLEPAVDVGGPRVASATRPAAPAAPVAPKATAPVAPKAVTPAPPAAGAAPQAANRRVVDSLDLGTTSITGNAELPKVLYIVPWKKSDLGDLVGRPVNTLLDEVLAPVDPAVFQRHLSYYDSLYGEPKKEE
jgi:hypothetical protein